MSPCQSYSYYEPMQVYAFESVPDFEDEFGPSILLSASPDISCPLVCVLGLAVVVLHVSYFKVFE